jgi:hypothetical protein
MVFLEERRDLIGREKTAIIFVNKNKRICVFFYEVLGPIFKI